MLDAGALGRGVGYGDLYDAIRTAFDGIHAEGQLKEDIMAAPERFVALDPSTPLALLDQKHAKKKLALITNSEWSYTATIMEYAFDRYLPADMTWRDMFDVVVVSARKPDFFTRDNPVFEIANEGGLLRPAGKIERGRAYLGGDATKVETCLGVHGDQVLYVGDHIFSDVNVSKKIQQWRTALILRELEEEVAAADAFYDQRVELEGLMREKERLESAHCAIRIAELRADEGYGPRDERTRDELRAENQRIRSQLEALDVRIRPLAAAASDLVGERWGPLMRAGNDKSHLARQVERYADVYLARVGDFLHETPFAYLRSVRGTLPHD
jgi:hypothetical protein